MVVRMSTHRFRVESVFHHRDDGSINEFYRLWRWGRKWYGLKGWVPVVASYTFGGENFTFFSRNEVDKRIENICKHGPDCAERHIEEVLL